MLRRALGGLAVLLTMTSCSGSTDIVDPQDLNYVTAIGIDYVDGRYVGYYQMLDFASVAKTETNANDQSPMIWVGHGQGSTLNDAMFEIYKTSQSMIVWSHMTAVIFGEGAIRHGLEHVFDSLPRYHEIRLTPWVYATKDKMEDILMMNGFFRQSALNTILHEPKSIFIQNSQLEPVQLFELMRSAFEPGETAYIPAVSINKTQWKDQKGKEEKPYVSGAYFIKEKRLQSLVPIKQLQGMRWLTEESNRISVLVPSEDKTDVQIIFLDPKSSISVRPGPTPTFEVEIQTKGYISSRQNERYLSLSQLEAASNIKIEEEVRQMVEHSIRTKTDLLNLEHAMYKKANRAWKALGNDTSLFDMNPVVEIKVNSRISHSGALKNAMIGEVAR
ncbi:MULTISPECIES: Ger(x)C family spore germination protein [unclassified Paenibacillus]|uniref:Ger(x)C family spore germination protein n=1 Tax=unclassified Paenibacillus TaxID=185978 RepID=UPI0009563A23|nr:MULTISPECIES: Ger(x)C family spore germination protein [unclassified Paenibacillus]ASS65324.1 Ger(x)C family spore germination protein [Paenibacillus sp. RUD330]SIQ39851.1 germination protein, Ger(x)C family [Paenibacillus sp. RU4X]SIQ62029.1 germination protein, Ger(x)C family [Paenibacillus sp. RU4T]